MENVVTSAVGLQIGRDKSGFRLVKVFEVRRGGWREKGWTRLLTLVFFSTFTFIILRMPLCTSTLAWKKYRPRFLSTRKRRRRGDEDEGREVGRKEGK